MYVGTTLLFAEQSSDCLEGWLKSYIFEAHNHDELKQKATHKAHQVIQSAKSGVTVNYFGIEDIFKVSGPFKHHSVTGRESIWDITFKSAKDLIQPKHKWTCLLRNGV